MPDYDAFLLVSFGGPEAPEDVMPFLENVTRGRGVPRERLAEVARHYELFGGVSPINQHCRDLLAAVEKDFRGAGLDLPLYWGNRNWQPLLTRTVEQMAADGVRRAVAFVTSAYGSYSSCRQYLDDIAQAVAQAGPTAPRIDKIGHYYRHPGFIEPFAEATLAAIASLPPGARQGAALAFTAHSVPESMAAASGPGGGLYAAQLTEAASLVADRVAGEEGRRRPWQLVYQSRSGPPSVPWLGPDIGDHISGLSQAGAPGVVAIPVGFTSDHLEVVYDLDTEAGGAARRLGLAFARAATPGTHPRFVSMITELVSGQMAAPDPFPPADSPFCKGECCIPAAAGGRGGAG